MNAGQQVKHPTVLEYRRQSTSTMLIGRACLLLGFSLLILASGCSSCYKTAVSLIPDNEWHDVYENRGGEIQRVLVTKQTECPDCATADTCCDTARVVAQALRTEGIVTSTEAALRERDVNKPAQFTILDSTDFSLDGAKKLMTINPGSALLARTRQANVVIRVIIDFRREHFWPEYGARAVEE